MTALSEPEEEGLVKAIIWADRSGHAWTAGQVKWAAEDILASRGDRCPLVKNWTASFMKRESQLRQHHARTMDKAMAAGMVPEKVDQFFDIVGLSTQRSQLQGIEADSCFFGGWSSA